MMMKNKVVTLGVTAITCLIYYSSVQAKPLEDIPKGFAKNVILLIPDGTSASAVTLTRWVINDGKPLNMDQIASGLARTHTALNPITDSAPAATAIATGYKTEDKIIGLKPSQVQLYGARTVSDAEHYAPAASVLEAAKWAGFSTGLIATAEIMHATPAGFSAHSKNRNHYNDISEQQIHQYIDVVFGGGLDYLKPVAKVNSANEAPKESKSSKVRIDEEDMIDILKSNDYQVIYTQDELKKTNQTKVWGLFAAHDMQYEIDRLKQDVVEPSLAEMTEKAISLLSSKESNPNSDKGFFLMVEGSKTDWVAHSNSIITLMQEIKAFDDAVGIALQFAKNRQDTLVIVATDHGNGGLSIGNTITNTDYSKLEKKAFVEVLRKIKDSDLNLGDALATAKEADIERLFFETTHIQLEAAELAQLKAEIKKYHGSDQDDYTNYYRINTAVAQLINARAGIAMTTNGHTGEDVPFYVYTDNAQHQLTGTIQNSDIALYISKAIGVDLDEVTRQLFVPESEFLSKDWVLESRDNDPKNTFIKVRFQDQSFTIMENKNYVIVDQTGEQLKYNGVNVYNETQFFIPAAAIMAIENAVKK